MPCSPGPLGISAGLCWPIGCLVLLDRKNFGPHRPWLIIFLVASAAAIGWYAAVSWHSTQWPSGASPPGLACGVAAGLLILFEFFLWPRKTLFRVWRIGRTQSWLRAHIWLGLLTVPLIAVHAWRELGGVLSTTLVILFAIVIASGIFGLALQQFLPRMITAAVPRETLYLQIDSVAKQACDEARAKLLQVVGQAFQPDGRNVDAVASTTAGAPMNSALDGGGTTSTRSAVRLESLTYDRSPAAVVWQRFDTEIAPYLLAGAKSGSVLASEAAAGNYFRGLRESVPTTYHPTVDALEGFCRERRQFDVQRRLHLWLHTWLWVHLPLSAALVVLMFVHIFVALKYW